MATYKNEFKNIVNVSGEKQIDELTAQLKLSEDALDKVNQKLADSQAEVQKLQRDLENVKRGKGFAGLEDDLDRFKATAKVAEIEFKKFLSVVNIPEDAISQETELRVSSLIDKVRNGSATVSQAITKIKTDFAYLMSENYASSGGLFDSEMVSSFTTALESLSSTLTDVKDKVDTLLVKGPASGGGGDGFSGAAASAADYTRLLEMMDEAAKAMTEDVRGSYETITNLIYSVSALGTIDASSLARVSNTFQSIADISRNKIGTKSVENLVDMVKRLSTISESIGWRGVRFNIEIPKVTKTSLENLSTYLPKIVEVDVERLERLSKVDLSNFSSDKLKITKAGIGNLASLANVVQGLETLQTKVDEIQGRLAPTEPILEPVATDDYVEPLEEAIEEVTQKTEEAAERRIEAEERVAEAAKQMAAEKEQIADASGAAQEAVANAQELAESQRQIGISAQETKDQVTNAAQAEVEAIKEVTAAAKEQGRAADIAAKSMMMSGGFSQESINEIKEELIGKNVSSEQADRIANDFKNIRGEITKTKATVLDTASHTEKVVNVTIEAVEKLESGLKRITTKSTDYKFNRKDNDWERTDKEVVTLDYNGTRVDATPTADNAKATAEALKKASTAMAELIQNETKFTGLKEATNQAQYLNHEIEKGKEEVELYVQRYQELAGVSRMEAMQTIVGQSNVTKAIQARGASMATLQDKWEAEKVKVQEVYDKLIEMRDAAKAMASDENSGPTERYKLPEFVSYLDTIEKMLPDVAELLKKTFNAADAPEVIEAFSNVLSKMREIEKAKKAFESAASLQMNPAQKSSAMNQLALLSVKAQNALFGAEQSGAPAQFTVGIKETIAAIDEFAAKVKSGQVTNQEFADSFKIIKGEADVVIGSLKNVTTSTQQVTKEEEKAAKAAEREAEFQRKRHDSLEQINKDLARTVQQLKERGLSSKYINEGRELIEANEESLGHVTIDNDSWKGITESATDYLARMKEIIAHTETLGHKIKRVFSQKFGYAVMAAAAMQVRKAIREIYTNVVELDTAMTELRKVTDETAYSYTKFLDNAAIGAQKLGVSMTELVNATADFARLGYSLTDANTLAEVATVYKNVGDGISSIDEASSSIISTMKAFKMEASDAMLIVDKFNHTGNNFAITSQGVGEALTRSASSLAVANNSLDESIALITAANTVVQNPETVGETLRPVA